MSSKPSRVSPNQLDTCRSGNNVAQTDTDNVFLPLTRHWYGNGCQVPGATLARLQQLTKRRSDFRERRCARVREQRFRVLCGIQLPEP